ncbi:redoxin domain-containing protein [Flavobacteriaceae bacterium R33]|uniref:Redoxin domain-containing protein n=2 Tax=Poritiphilus flavus TaxID=2697053 RepID=A0A6L9E8R8_9FLAO|nr:redoxin domain-containing protein [Poritiphilus flavus]
MVVQGSLDNELLYENLKYELGYQRSFQPISDRLKNMQEIDLNYAYLKSQKDKLIQERQDHLNDLFAKHPNSFFTKYKKAGQNPLLADSGGPDGTSDQARVARYRSRFWDKMDFSDIRLLYTPVVTNKLKRYITRLTPQHPDSINKASDYLIQKALNYPEYFKFFANWIALNYEPSKTTFMDKEAVYVHMIQNYFTHERAFWSDSTLVSALQQRAGEMASSLVGKKGPDVVSRDINGQTRSIYDIKSPYIIVYMYNPSCEHCIEETPKLIQFYHEWKNKGVEVFGIAIDTDDTEWRDYVAKSGMPWTNVFDPTNRSIYGKYYVDITPEIYVLNPERTIIAKNLQVHHLAEVINQDRMEYR